MIKVMKYRVAIKINECPFILERKAIEWKESSVSRYIIDATRIDDCDCVCIKVSNEDELYITDNYIVTHNTTVALSAPKPLLLDFDNGVKRVNMSHLDGVDIVQIDTWNDVKQVLQEDLSAYQTIVVDTIGKMMDFIISYKCGTRQPSIRDWGGINAEFSWLTRTLSGMCKHIVFVAHRDTRKEGDDTVFIPALREKSYNSIVTDLDLLGYLEMRSENGRQRRTITFDPTSRNDGKNVCNLPSVMEIPTILDAKANSIAKNEFISSGIINPYLNMLATKKAAQEKYDSVIAEIREQIEFITDAQSANDFASRINNFEHVGSSLAMARNLFVKKVGSLGLVYDKETKMYGDAAA
jgi:AAA domain